MKAIKILMKVVLTIVFMYVISAQINMIYEHLHIDIVTYTQVIIVITCILISIATWWKFHVFMGQIMKCTCYLLISIALFIQYFVTGWTWLTKDEGNDMVFLFWVYDLPLLLSLFVLIFSYYFIYKLPVKKIDE